MSGPSITALEKEYVLDMMDNCWYGPKKYEYVETFEKEFAKFVGIQQIPYILAAFSKIRKF